MNKYIALAFTAVTLIGCGSSGASGGGMKKDLAVKILTDKSEVAEGKSIFFDSNVTGADGMVSYAWKEGNSTLGSDKNLTKSDFTVGTHTIVLNVKNGDKTATDSKTIKVSSFLVSLSSLKTTYDKDENVTVKANVNGNTQNGVTYAWMKDGVTVADTTAELNITDFNLSNHTVLVIASVNGIEKNATININVSDFSIIEPRVLSTRKDEVLVDTDNNLMWVSDDDISKKACLAVHASKSDNNITQQTFEENATAQTFCEKLNFAGFDENSTNPWRKPTVTEISSFITTTINANISPAYYAPCKILVGTEDGINKAVITRYGDGKFGGKAGDLYSKTMDEALVSSKNIGIRCVRKVN